MWIDANEYILHRILSWYALHVDTSFLRIRNCLIEFAVFIFIFSVTDVAAAASVQLKRNDNSNKNQQEQHPKRAWQSTK